jgi:deazaflavin-dependent oxidoreductase (nitroreductase family)
MTDWITFFTSLHIAVYRLTGGLLGSRLGKQSILLLHSVGARTGKKHITTLSYYRDGKNFLVVASNWGKPSHPGWYYNLLKDPCTTIQVRAKVIEVQAHPAKAGEYQRLWQLVTSQNGQYLRYQQGLARHIPIVILTPSD